MDTLGTPRYGAARLPSYVIVVLHGIADQVMAAQRRRLQRNYDRRVGWVDQVRSTPTVESGLARRRLTRGS